MICDLSDYAPGDDFEPGAVTRTCFACGVTERDTPIPHRCAKAGDAKRARRKERAVVRYNRLRARLGMEGRVAERCDLCGVDALPGRSSHRCLPDQRPTVRPHAAAWLASDSWSREAPPITYNPNPRGDMNT